MSRPRSKTSGPPGSASSRGGSRSGLRCVRLNIDDGPAEIWLKLENLQPIGSFKVRGAGNAMSLAPREALAKGVYTASAGNMAQGVAWNARRLGVPATVVVPEHAPQTKLAAIERLGAKAVKLPFARWWQVLEDHGYPGIEGLFVHPVSDPAVIAGNGTIGLEILEDLPDVDAVVVPFGGGGLSCGIATALRALCAPRRASSPPRSRRRRPSRRRSPPAGPSPSITRRASWTASAASRMLPEMWPLASQLLAGSLVVSVARAAAAVRLLAERNRVIAEGAGATSVAAALTGKAGAGKVVCVVSGGNIDPAKLAKILNGEIP